jgi:Na+/H+ antiporter NhaD/arsenite permease-like protein
MAKTGLLQVMSLKLYKLFGMALTLVVLAMICGIGLLSSLLSNVPVAAGSKCSCCFDVIRYRAC